jgi:hypothetical protein
MPLSDASTTRAPWSAAHAKAAAMSHARPLPDASRARSGTMPAFGAPQVMSPLPWVPSVSARRAAHARSREAKREPGVLRQETLGLRPARASDAETRRRSLASTKAKARAGVRDVCQRARVAWIPAVCASLLPFSHGCRSGTGSARAPADARSSSLVPSGRGPSAGPGARVSGAMRGLRDAPLQGSERAVASARRPTSTTVQRGPVGPVAAQGNADPVGDQRRQVRSSRSRRSHRRPGSASLLTRPPGRAAATARSPAVVAACFSRSGVDRF